MLSALSVLFAAVPPPPKSDIIPLLLKLKRRGLDLTSGRPVSFASDFTPNQALFVLAGAALAETCTAKVHSTHECRGRACIARYYEACIAYPSWLTAQYPCTAPPVPSSIIL
jgi:hypothetical protein